MTKFSSVTNSVLDLIGDTPLLHAKKLFPGRHVSLFLKCEMFNPSLSFKDRLVLHIVEQMEKAKQLQPGGMIIEASSGNTGSALAMIATVKGYRCKITVPEKTSAEKIATMRAFGAEVIVCAGKAKPGSPEHYVTKAKLLVEATAGAVLLNQYSNPENPMTHYQYTGQEILDQLEGKVDYFVAAASSGGTVTGIGKRLKVHNSQIKVIMPDPVGSVYYSAFHGDSLPEAKPFKVEGVGKDYVCDVIDLAVVDEVVQVNDEQAFAAVNLLARKEGLLAGGSAGINLHAALALAEQLEEKKQSANIVVMLPDSGFKYLSKMFN